MPVAPNRRGFLKDLGLSAAALPFVMNLPSLAMANHTQRKQRLVVMFSPNGVVPDTFWPDQQGKEFALKESLSPLVPYQDRTLLLKGICDRVRGDGDSHMRGIGCLLTGIELYPGNIQGGSNTPAGWASGISIDQEIKNHLQKQEATKTRFGSLEFGILVPNRADTWTRMVYAGANQPVAPIGDPNQMFSKLYGRSKDRQVLASILDDLTQDLKKVRESISSEDRRLLDEHAAFVREMEKELQAEAASKIIHRMPQIEPDIKEANDNMPSISKTQIELLVNSFTNDFARIATLQYTNSVGQAKMRWLDINEGHHSLSHESDSKQEAQDKLTKINHWFCQQFAYLAKRLAETPEPGGGGSLLDNTSIIWTNELGKGNTHTLDDIPFVLVGNGLDFEMCRSLKFERVAHNCLHLSLARAFGHDLKTFGNPDFCGGGPLELG